MSEISMSSVQSWSDVLRALRAQAEAHRGSITLSPDTPDEVMFPRTTGQDVLAISVVFDAAVRAHASSAALQRWLAESDLIASESPWTLADTYVGNRSYWATLATVAIELDRVHAALPDTELWRVAMAELATERGPLRNAAGAMLITLFTAPTWAEMADRQLDLFRVLRGEDHLDHPVVPTVPRTCNADVLELARYWTEQLARIGRDPIDTHHRLAYAGWPEAVGNVLRHAKRGAPRSIYVGNAEFWHALALLAQSDASGEAPAPWAPQVPPSEDAALVRNAAPVDHGAKVDFPDAGTWDDAARMQRDFLAKLRGEDVLPGGRLVGRIPRTTNGDVRQLAAYWSTALRKVGEHHDADLSYRHVIDRWTAALAEVDRLPLDAHPDALYPHNTEFWTALMTIAIQVAVTAETPKGWTLFKQSLASTVGDFPQTLENLPDTYRDFFGVVGDKLKNFAATVLARPLLYAGGGVAAVTLLYLLLRRRPDVRPESSS